jgi:exportin-1
LTQLQEHPEAWLVVDKILEYSKSSSAKFYGLQILESVIKYRWKVLPREQCDGIKNYIVNLIIKLSSDEATLRSEKLFLRKLNQVLVQVSIHRPDQIGLTEMSYTTPSFIYQKQIKILFHVSLTQ